MNQLELLLNYQETDLEVDEYEMELKQSPLRQKLVRLRNFLVNAQKKLDKAETDLDTLSKRMNEIKNDIEQVRTKEADISNASKAIDVSNVEALEEIIRKSERLCEDIEYYEKLLWKARTEAVTINNTHHEIFSKAVKAKTDYKKMKAVYDDEFKEASEKLEELKKKREEAAQPISSELLENYRRVKSHRVPPMALLSSDQCTGCNMSLPSVVTRSAQQGIIIECENCGRILYTED